MRRLLPLILALVLACVLIGQPIFAAVSVRQSSSSVTPTTIVFGSPPTNGNIVVLVRSADSAGTSTSAVDSNSTALSLVCTVVNGAAKSYVYAYAASGSPTGTYTVNTFGGTTAQGGIEVQGGSISTLQCSGAGFTSSTSGTTSTIAHVGAGSIEICNEAVAAYSSETIDGGSVNAFGQNGPRSGYTTPIGFVANSACTANFSSNRTGAITLIAIWPGPTFLHITDCGSGITPRNCTVTAPSNGNTEVVQLSTLGTTASATVKDSINFFTLEHTSCLAGNAICIATFDNPVSGSPGTTITASTGSASFDEFCFAEISGLQAAGANSFTGNSSASGSTFLATIAGVSAGDAQLTLGDAASLVGGASVTLSNGVLHTWCGTSDAEGKNVLATSTASSTSTYTASTSYTSAALEYADYAVPASTPTPAPTTIRNPGRTWLGASTGTLGSFFLLSAGSYIAPLRPGLTCIMRVDGGDECWREFPAAWAA